jgi:hypothetical protein
MTTDELIDIARRKSLPEVADRLDEQQRAIKVIRTWAAFYLDDFDDENRGVLSDIVRKCDQVTK